MNELFEQLVEKQNYWDAQLVGKNLFCREPGNLNIFSPYFDFCLKIANFPIEFETRSFFLNEAELALSIFSEKVQIEHYSLRIITEKRRELVETARSINEAQNMSSKQESNMKIEENDRSLQGLAKLEGAFEYIMKQEDLDDVLAKTAKYEESLSKELFTQRQKSEYTALTKDFSNLVSEAMERLNLESDKEYNKKAVSSFKKAFDLFKSDEDKFKKHDTSLYELVSNYLFAFDAKRLFSETLIYYNHIYTYIFNKLDDDGKFRFTQFSFDVPKNQ